MELGEEAGIEKGRHSSPVDYTRLVSFNAGEI